MQKNLIMTNIVFISILMNFILFLLSLKKPLGDCFQKSRQTAPFTSFLPKYYREAQITMEADILLLNSFCQICVMYLLKSLCKFYLSVRENIHSHFLVHIFFSIFNRFCLFLKYFTIFFPLFFQPFLLTLLSLSLCPPT